MSPGLDDADARRRAATDLDSNLVVMAGAGTGKTSLLVERALVAVGSGHAELDALGAITFTEKAAGEMRQRLAEGLERLRALGAGERQARDDDGPAERAFTYLADASGTAPAQIAARALAGIESLDRATVVTIHALCAQLLRAHPVEAGVDPGFAVDAGEHESRLRDELWREWLTRELGPDADPRRDALWGELLDRTTLDELAELAAGLASFAVPLALLEAPHPTLRALYGRRAARLAEAIAPLLGDTLGPVAARQVRETYETLTALASDGTFEPSSWLQERLLAKKYDAGGKRLDSMTDAEAKRRTREAGRLLHDLLKIDDHTVALALELLVPFARESRERFLAGGFVSFDGLLALTRDLLRDHPQVRRRVKRRFAALLVDEFQDTDPLQYEIVLLLGERLDDEAQDPWSATLAAGRLFVVGDAKQSIYRFRGADYAAFARAVGRIVDAGGARLELTTNFRSLPGVLDPVNRLFAAPGGCWTPSDEQPDYVAIGARRPDGDTDPAVEVWTVSDAAAGADARRDAEGRRIAEAIAGWVERDRTCSYREVSILFRSFGAIGRYLRPLRALGVPFVVDGGREFLQRPEVTELLAILHCIARSWDRPALLAYLRSPAGGCSDRELADYRRDGGTWSRLAAAHVDETAHPRVTRALGRIRTIADATRDLPVDATVREVVRRTRLLPLGAAAFEGPQRVANLEKLAAAAGELARDGRLSLEQVVEAIAEGRLEEIKTDRPLADDAAEAVRITSIHRFKGLENRIVIVPDLARGELPRSSPATGVAAGRLDDGTPTLAIGLDGHDNRVRARHLEQERLHAEAEETRVLYVALTRARDRLIVLAGSGRGSAPWVEALVPWGYAADRPPGDGARLDDAAVVHRRPAPDSQAAARRSEPAGVAPARAVDAFETARAACLAATPSFRAPSGEERRVESPASSPETARRAAPLGRALGSLLHLALERVEPRSIERLATLIERWTPSVAARHEVDVGALAAAAAPLVERFVDSPLAARLRSVEIVGRELPILLSLDDGRRYRGSLDLLYRDDDGALVVADHKTDAEDDDALLRERYAPQMAIYREAVRRSLELERAPRGELWLVRHGRIVTLDAALD